MATRLTKPIFGVDSYGPTPTSLHHEIGSHFAFRYSSHQEGKAITKAEYMDNTDADIATVVVFEDGAGNALLGYDQGRNDALFADQQTRAAGRPSGRPLYFAVDEDVTDLDRLDAYFAGVATVMGKDYCGPYGSAPVCAHFFAQGFKWGAQTCAWSEGEIDSKAQIYQYAINMTIQGYSIDYDRAYYEDYGQWGYKPPAPTDKHDYDRFFEGPFRYKGKRIYERQLVIDYDSFMKHPRRNAKKLDAIKELLKLDLERLASVASIHRMPGELLPAEWSAFDRGTRYQLIAKRVKGEVVK